MWQGHPHGVHLSASKGTLLSPPPHTHSLDHFLQAVRLAELEVEYQRMKGAMKAKAHELQGQLAMFGHAPPLAVSLASDPLFAAVRGGPPAPGAPQPAAAPPMMLPPPQQQFAYPPPQQQGMPQPYPYGMPPPAGAPPGMPYGMPPPGAVLPGAKREPQFHQVPPPKRADMRRESRGCEREGGRRGL